MKSPNAILAPILLASCAVASLIAPLVGRSEAIQKRQAHVRRATTDICAYIDAPLQVTVSGTLVTVGVITTCLCVSEIPVFLTTNIVADAAVALIGVDATTASLEALINSSGGEQCTYPDHAVAQCTQGTPCGFTCSDGFTATQTDCVCDAPLTVCNGQCGLYPNGCPSSVPRKRSAPVCPSDFALCGVPWNSRGWECVDISSDLESCGGCTIASPFSNRAQLNGVDCSSIRHADEVECHRGECFVASCVAGWRPALSHKSCVPKPRMDPGRLVDANGVAY